MIILLLLLLSACTLDRSGTIDLFPSEPSSDGTYDPGNPDPDPGGDGPADPDPSGGGGSSPTGSASTAANGGSSGSTQQGSGTGPSSGGSGGASSASSSSGGAACDAATCPNGCCDGDTCRQGDEASACGKGGATCWNCTALCGWYAYCPAAGQGTVQGWCGTDQACHTDGNSPWTCCPNGLQCPAEGGGGICL